MSKILLIPKCSKLNPMHNVSVMRIQAQKVVRAIFCRVQNIIWYKLLVLCSFRWICLLFGLVFFVLFGTRTFFFTYKGQTICNYMHVICAGNRLMQM